MTEVTDVIVGAVLIIDTGVSSTDKITSNGNTRSQTHKLTLQIARTVIQDPKWGSLIWHATNFQTPSGRLSHRCCRISRVVCPALTTAAS